MRVTVDPDVCQASAVCMALAPEIFEVRGDGYLYVLDEEPGEEHRQSVEEAARSCPTQAISIEG